MGPIYTATVSLLSTFTVVGTCNQGIQCGEDEIRAFQSPITKLVPSAPPIEWPTNDKEKSFRYLDLPALRNMEIYNHRSKQLGMAQLDSFFINNPTVKAITLVGVIEVCLRRLIRRNPQQEVIHIDIPGTLRPLVVQAFQNQAPRISEMHNLKNLAVAVKEDDSAGRILSRESLWVYDMAANLTFVRFTNS